MPFEVLMLGVALLPLVASWLCGWHGFIIAALLWVRMALQTHHNGLLSDQGQSRAFWAFFAVGLVGGVIGVWAH